MDLLTRLIINKLKNQRGVTPTGTIEITENGEHDVTNYATANVNVAASAGEADVFFYDYDGSIVESYTKEAFLALTEMPPNPTHTGLIADGWNWSISDAKAYVTNLGKLVIGQTYHTASDKCEFEIELNANTGLTVTLNMSGTKDWGDETTDSNTSHTYASYGKYTITCDGSSITSGLLFGQDSGNFNLCYTVARLNNVTSLPTNAFSYCTNLKTVIFSNSFRTLGTLAFYRCYSLKTLILPNGISTIENQCFVENYSLSIVSLPKTIIKIESSSFQSCQSIKLLTCSDQLSYFNTSAFNGCIALETILFNSISDSFGIGGNCFLNCKNLKKVILPTMARINSNTFDGCNNLEEIKLPTTITRIDSNVLQYTYNLKVLDFSEYTTVPSNVNTVAFTNINPLLKIIVPDDLYTTWIATSNWSHVTNNIVKASQV